MRQITELLISFASLLTGLLAGLGVPGNLNAQPLTVYDDVLRNSFEDWSWADHDLAEQGTVHSGQLAISMDPDSWTGIFFHHSSGLNVADYDVLTFWIHGGAAGGQSLGFVLQIGETVLGSVALSDYLPAGPPAGTWVEVEIPFADLGVTGGFDGVIFQDWSGGDQATVFFDDLSLRPSLNPPSVVAIEVDPNADRRPIDPRVYGVNFGESPQIEELRYPLRRWGGNATTRYNWRVDVSNRAADYFFQNIPNPDPGTLPHGSAADQFIDSTRQNGGEVLLTVPLIGWTPSEQDRQKRWGFSVASYGPQDLVECDLYGDPPPPWCSEDAGDGECASVVNNTGSCIDGLIVGNDPADTSDAIDSSFVTDWMAHIAGRVGSASAGGVRLFALDNEPMLWDSTHRDVHPAPLSYDEAWTRTVDVASAIKGADGTAEALGPVAWGWCAFFTSAADAADGFCMDGPDRQAHGGLPFLAWYLEQVCQHESVTGVRLVDYLDVHFYPQGHVSGLGGASDDEDAETAARRLRSIKELYDPSYVSESWIGQPVFLIPRMRDWIDQHCPGMGLALSEYKWGPDDGPTGALAQAEALAIFGREGVDIASRWEAPQPGTRSEDAFRLYLDYDGSGARLEGESVRATSSDVDAVGAYAVRSAGQALYVLLFNKDTVVRDVDVTVAGGLNGTIEIHAFDTTQSLGSRGSIAADGAGFSLTLPARSATLAVALGPGLANGCSPDESILCLNDDRFKVEVEWRDFKGKTGVGQVVSFSSADSGLFWFFSKDNWEMMVKVLNGCKTTNHFWFFAAATTNVEYTLRVTDTATGVVKEYFNPLGNSAAAITDTEAFATCP